VPTGWAERFVWWQFQSESVFFFAIPTNFSWTPDRSTVDHHHQDEEFLILPCDWRFLPKLGPLRPLACGPFSSLTPLSAPVTCFDAQEVHRQSIFFRESLVQRSIIFRVN
jgi:hypothetical protein